jgi:hypothetical protein
MNALDSQVQFNIIASTNKVQGGKSVITYFVLNCVLSPFDSQGASRQHIQQSCKDLSLILPIYILQTLSFMVADLCQVVFAPWGARKKHKNVTN